MSSNWFIFPDKKYINTFLCIFTLNTNECVCRISKDPLFFECNPFLANILDGKEKFIQKELENSRNIDVFAFRLYNFVSKLISSRGITLTNYDTSFYKSLLSNLKRIGWENITSVDSTLKNITVSVKSLDKKRTINVKFNIPDNFPNDPPTVTSDLPTEISFDWNQNKSKLSDILTIIQKEMPSYENLWNELEDLDRNTIVIDPHKPSLKSCYRLVFINKQLWVYIETKTAGFRPLIKFKGAEKCKREFQQNYEQKCIEWDSSFTIRQNLEKILDIKFPQRGIDNVEVEIECSICFCERYGGEYPDVVCENEKCSKHFHRICLFDALKENHSTNQGFHTIYGKCPSCGYDIHCNAS